MTIVLLWEGDGDGDGDEDGTVALPGGSCKSSIVILNQFIVAE